MLNILCDVIHDVMFMSDGFNWSGNRAVSEWLQLLQQSVDILNVLIVLGSVEYVIEIFCLCTVYRL